MTDTQQVTFWRILIGAIITFVMTALASVVGALFIKLDDMRDIHSEDMRIAQEAFGETDRTQEAVLERLKSIENDITMIEAQLIHMPEEFDDDDRWHKSEEILYQKGIENRLRRLEQYHPPFRGYMRIE